MADFLKTAIVRVQLDASDLEKSAARLSKALDKDKEAAAALRKELKQPLDPAVEEEKRLALLKLERQIKVNGASFAEYQKQIAQTDKITQLSVNNQEGSLEQLRLILSNLNIEYKKLSESGRENSEEGIALGETIKQVTDKLKEEEKAIGNTFRNVGNYEEALIEANKPLLEQLKLLEQQKEKLTQSKAAVEQGRTTIGGFGKGIVTASDSVNNFTASLDGNNSSVDAVNASLLQYDAELDTVDKSIQAVNEQIKQNTIGFNNADGSIKGITATTESTGNSLAGLNSKLKSLKESAQTLDIDTEEFKKVTAEIEKTSFAIAQATGKVDEFGNKEPKNPAKKAFEDTFEAAGALTASIGLLTIAFGKNETIQAVQEKTLQAVAIAQTVANIAKSKGAIIDTAAGIRTIFLTAKQVIYTAAVGASTGALKVFKLALASTGIGAFVVAIGALVTYLILQRNKTKELTEAQKAYNAAIKEAAISEDLQITKANALFTALTNTNKGSVERKNLITEINKTYGTTLSNLSSEAKFLDAVAEAQKNVIAGIKAKIQAKLEEEKLETLIREEQKLSDAYQIARNKRIDAEETLAFERKKANNDLAISNARVLRDQSIIAQEQAAKNYSDNIAQQKVILENFAKFATANTLLTDKEKADALKAQQEKYKNFVDKSAAILQQLYDFETKLDEASVDATIQTLADKEKAEQDALRISKERLKQSLQDELDAIKDTTAEEKREKAYAQQQLNLRLEQIEEEYLSNSLDINQKYREIETDRINEENKKRLDRELVELNKSAGYKRLYIEENIKDEREKNIALIQLEIDTQKELIRIAEETANIDLFISDEEKDAIDDAKFKLAELELQLRQINKTPLKIIPDDFKEKFDQAISIINDVFTSFTNAVNAGFENQRNQIDKTTKSQVEGIEKSTLTEKQKQKQLEKINLDSQKKKYQVDLDAFNFNKGIQITQTIINTAGAVVAALNNPVPFVGAILAGVAAATGAVQLGIIASQQPPAPPFYEGGYTGDGNPYDVSNALGKKNYIYHKSEYVVPNKILKTKEGGVLVSALEAMRLNNKSSLGIGGFADGGFSTAAINNNVTTRLESEALASAISNSLKNVQIITRITDINRVNKNLATTKVRSTIR